MLTEEERRLKLLSSKQRRSTNHGNALSIYFAHPDGDTVEA